MHKSTKIKDETVRTKTNTVFYLSLQMLHSDGIFLQIQTTPKAKIVTAEKT